MSFPSYPANGQQTVVNGITYIYVSASNLWSRVTGGLTSTTYLAISSTTQSTGTTTGALVVAGGIGVGGNINIGGDLYKNGVLFTGGLGYTGSVGYTGSAGYAGSAGYWGSVGYTGSTGTQGISGYTGSTGTQGISGYTGSTGTQGISGYTGSEGYWGSVGYTGSEGYWGSVGYTGSTGTQGISGYTGSVGYWGSTGYVGSRGESSFTYGPTPPATPVIGDRWFDSLTGAETVWTYDGDTSQWVEVAASGFVGRDGYTGSSGIGTRTTASGVTSSLTSGTTGTINITGFKGYNLYKIQVTTASWVRIYSSTAARSSDSSRLSGTDPASDAGVITEIITTGSKIVTLTPAVLGFNDETVPTTSIPIAVTNNSTVSTAITVTLTMVQTEQ